MCNGAPKLHQSAGAIIIDYPDDIAMLAVTERAAQMGMKANEAVTKVKAL